MNNFEKFIGKGLVFPLELENGSAVLKSGSELIKSSIFIILQWLEGTKFFQGQFGSKVALLTQEPNLAVIKNMLSSYIRDAVEKWETRVIVNNVEVYTQEDGGVSPGELRVEIFYQEIKSKTEDSFIYPFYQKTDI